MNQFENRQYINPGPIDGELLKLHGKHRADGVWSNNVEHDVLFARRSSVESHYRNIDTRIMPYIQLAGFYGVAKIGVMNVHCPLIIVLIERWRSETHTFHLPVGEATITLQDVGILTGLPVEGMAVTGHLQYNWADVYGQLLGQVPPEDVLKGHQVKMTWLSRNFSSLPVGANEYIVQCFARAWISRCIGGLLCPGQSNNYIHLMWLPLLEHLEQAGNYSWGSACLAWLYRELCRATRPSANGLGGYHQLLQLWAWERLPQLRPTFLENVVINQAMPYGFRWRSPLDLRNNHNKNVNDYRLDLDLQRPDQMEWEPYNNVIHLLPEYCRDGVNSWRSVVPLVCFHIIEWHQPDRCLRQFGMEQPIPCPPKNNDSVHSVDLRGHNDINWEDKFASFIFEWGNRWNRVVGTQLLNAPLHPRSQYMQWYTQRTRRWITQIGASMGSTADGVERIYHAGNASSSNEAGEIRMTSESILGALGARGRTSVEYPRQPVPHGVEIQPLSTPYEEFRSTRRSRRGMSERRTSVASIPISPGVHQVPPPLSWPYYPAHSLGSFDIPSMHHQHQFDQQQFYETQAGPSNYYESEAGPSRLNVDLNVSLSEGDRQPTNTYGQVDPVLHPDDFINDFFYSPHVSSTAGLGDPPLYSADYDDVMHMTHDQNPNELDPQNNMDASSSRSSRRNSRRF